MAEIVSKHLKQAIMNFKTIKSIILLTGIVLTSSCSSDDNSDDTENIQMNQVTFDGASYPLTTAWISDENTTTNDPSDIGFNLFNKTTAEINDGDDLIDITTIYFDFTEVELQEKTYTDILDYNISINGTRTSGDFTAGTVLLSDNDASSDIYASSSMVTINDLTATTIDLTFSFTRNDGQVISGSYNGNYTVPNTSN